MWVEIKKKNSSTSGDWDHGSLHNFWCCWIWPLWICGPDSGHIHIRFSASQREGREGWFEGKEEEEKEESLVLVDYFVAGEVFFFGFIILCLGEVNWWIDEILLGPNEVSLKLPCSVLASFLFWKKGWVLPPFWVFFWDATSERMTIGHQRGEHKCCETFTLSPCEKTEEGEERGWFGWLWVSALLSHKSPISFSATWQITYPPHMLVLRSRLIHKSWWRDWMLFVRICCWYHLFNMNPCSSSTAVAAIKLFLKQMGVWHSHRVMKAFQCT